MLEFMRKSANSIFIKALLGLLILSFAAWGIGDIFNGRASSTAVATVGESEISTAEFRGEYARELQRMSQIFGQEISREQGQAMGIGNLLVSRLVQSALINESAKNLGLLITNDQILDEIRRTPDFFNDAGQFDRNIFINILGRSGFSEDSYIARVRESMARLQFLGPIREGALVPAGMIKVLYTHAAEKRTAEIIRIEHAKLQNIKVPTGDDLSQYHKANAAKFMAPEYRKLTAIVLRSAALAEGIAVSEQDIQTAYDEHEAEYLTPETRKLRQILVSDEATANKAKVLLAGGESLSDVAIEVGANPEMIDIGTFTTADASTLSPDIATAVFALAKGAHTDPMQSTLGWHVFEVVDITPSVVKPLAVVHDALAQQVKMDRALKSLFDMSNKLEDLLGGGMTFEEAAASLGIETTRVAAVDNRGLGLDGKPVNTPYISDLINAAFPLEEGQDSQMTEATDGNAFFVARVDAITAPALRPLDTVIKEVTLAWTDQKRAEMAAELAKTAQQRLQGGEAAADIAKSIGFGATVTKPFTRDGKGLEQNALPANLIESVFALKTGEATSAEGTGAHTVARLSAITPATPDPASPTYRAVAEQALTDMQSDLLTELSVALEGTYDVTINQKAINDAY